MRAFVGNRAVGSAMNLEDMHGALGRLTLFYTARAGKARNGGDRVGMLVGGTSGHEATVAMSHEVDAIVVYCEFGLHFFDDAGDIG